MYAFESCKAERDQNTSSPGRLEAIYQLGLKTLWTWLQSRSLYKCRQFDPLIIIPIFSILIERFWLLSWMLMTISLLAVVLLWFMFPNKVWKGLLTWQTWVFCNTFLAWRFGKWMIEFFCLNPRYFLCIVKRIKMEEYKLSCTNFCVNSTLTPCWSDFLERVSNTWNNCIKKNKSFVVEHPEKHMLYTLMRSCLKIMKMN